MCEGGIEADVPVSNGIDIPRLRCRDFGVQGIRMLFQLFYYAI